MVFQVLKYDVVCDGTGCGRKVTSAPKVPAPIALLQHRKLHLHFVGRSAFHFAHKVAHRQAWRDRHKHVHVVRRQHAGDNLDAIFSANLSDDFPHPFADGPGEHLVPVLCYPNHMIAMIEDAMFSFLILHDLETRKMKGAGQRRFHFPGFKVILLSSR